MAAVPDANATAVLPNSQAAKHFSKVDLVGVPILAYSNSE